MNTQTVPELLETLIRSSGSVWIGKSVLEDEAHKKKYRIIFYSSAMLKRQG